MKNLLHTILVLKGYVKYCVHSSNPLIAKSKLYAGFVFLLIMLSISTTLFAQVAASWNYNTQTGSLGTTYSWINCSSGTNIVSGDDNQSTINWPFNFNFYNNTYTTANSLSISTNGFIRLDGIATNDFDIASSYNLTGPATNLGQIIGTSVQDCEVGSNGGWVRYLVTGTSPNRILTIEYNNIEIDFTDLRYADIQVSFYETLNKIVLKSGTDNIFATGADMGLHSGVNDFFHKWQEVQSGANNAWIEYKVPAMPAAASWNYVTQTGTLGTAQNWIDCSSGTTIVTGDDAQSSINWPFNFSFYDNSYITTNSLSIATNGFIRLDGVANTNYTTASAYDLTTTATGLGQIIALSVYDDFIGRTSNSWCKYLVSGSAPYRIFTIEFNDIEIDYNDGLYADVQVSFFETLNEIVLKFGNDNISVAGVDMGIHSGVSGFYNKWQEVQSGTNNTWIKYTRAIEVSATIGTSLASYSNLKTAFDKINDGTHRGAVTVKMNGNTVETVAAVLNASGTGSANYTSLNLYPTITGLSISGNLASPLIDLNGADNVTLDGRVNASGSTTDLIITNTSISSSATTSTIRFVNDATNNIVKYCQIKGSETVATSGVLFFSTTTVTTGNDNNTINNNSITNSANVNRPVNAIYSLGTAGKENNGNNISNNSVYDFLKHGTNSNGILLSSYSTAWTISGNSFYETGSFAPTGSVVYNAIQINNLIGTGFTITDNFIGGSSAQCGGTAWTKTNTYNNAFNGINMNVGTIQASSLQNNIIKSFNWSNSGNATWTAINIQDGNVNIGNITGNTIGGATGTGSVTITGGSTGQNVIGIDLSGIGDIYCQNNTIGSISATNANAANASNVYAVNRGNTGICTISNNSIGSTSQTNSIQSSSASSGNAQIVCGIYNTSGGILILEQNTISNLTNNTTNTNTSTTGLINGIASSGGIISITGNTINNLTIANANSSLTHTASVTGISLTCTNGINTITGNTIYNLSNTYTSFSGGVTGIYFGSTGISHTVSNNFIHSLSATGASSTTASLYGIKINTGQTTYFNNIITLSSNTETTIYGIYETGTSSNNNSIYFNTIFIGGSLGSGITNKSFGLYSAETMNTRDFRNNIFMNARSTTDGTNLHYALYIVSTGGSLTVDYNDYYVSGSGGTLGYYGADKTVLPVVTGQDVNSISIDPGFANAGGISALNYHTSAELPGVTGTGITTDYNDLARGAIPKMGALENNQYLWQGNTSTDFGTPGNWVGGVVPPEGAEIAFAVSPANHCVLDQNRTVKKITNSQSTYDLVVNGFQLTITGSLIFTNGAQIDATAASSVVKFSGTTTQSIPSGAFTSNTVNAFTLANSFGLTLNGNLTVTGTLTLTTGAFIIGANTLSLNGAISITSGILTGGSSSNIIWGGSGASTALPAVSLNNLTINRSNGIGIGGAVTVGGTLVLTNGTLTLGANTLTISGNSPTRTNGNIDAGNSTATLLFTNSTAISLPASIFSGNVNNLTINGSGGVTAGSSFTLNGILDLQSANPTAFIGVLAMGAYTLDLGSSASVSGPGDVTGIIRRTSFQVNTTYAFSHQFTSITFPNVGTLPTSMSLKTSLGNSPGWKTGAILRIYDLIQTGGSGTQAVLRTHYLDSELNGNDENKIVDWSYRFSIAMLVEHGRSNFNTSENWIELSNADVAFFPAGFGSVEVTQAESELTSLTWNGSVSSSWVTSGNWTPQGAPSDNTVVVIPDASTTPNDPFLPAIGTCGTITLENNAILNSQPEAELTLNGAGGAWSNQGGTFNAQNSTIIITNPEATINGTTNFANLTINNEASVTLTAGSITRISGSLTNNGVIDADFFQNTVEYNGYNQTIINPNGLTPGYHNLILSGTGIEIMPGTPLTIYGDFSVAASDSVTLAETMTVKDNFTIGSGTYFSTGNYNLSFGGNFENNGTFTATAGDSITFNGTSNQSITGTTTTIFDNLIINNISGVNLFHDIIIDTELILTNGNLSFGESTLAINGIISQSSGALDVTIFSSLTFGGSSAITLTEDLFTASPDIDNLTINRAGGLTIGCNLSVNGILNLESSNPLATKGSLDMWDGSEMTTLTMGGSATTIGPGDVTGIVRRTSFVPNITYTFGHQFTSVLFPDIGTLPTEIDVKIRIGTEPAWKPGAVKRIYDMIQTGGSGTLAVLTVHYLDSELNGNDESNIVNWSYLYLYDLLIENGRSNFNSSENWISISSVDMAYFSFVFGEFEVTLAESELTALTWNGSTSSSWVATDNWTPNGAPSDNTIVIIPDATTTSYDPELPAIGTCGTMTLENGSILNAETDAVLTLNGASGVWSNQGGIFNAGNSTVIITHADATLIGTTDFYNLTIDYDAALLLTTGSITRIAGVLSNNGILRAVFMPNTIEFNGADQTIINPNGMTAGYHNLILSGSGTKTLPATALNIYGNFSTSGTVTANASEAMTIAGNVTIGEGSQFVPGSFDHSIAGNIENNGSFNAATGSTISLIGTTAQSVTGSAPVTFDNLMINNSLGVSLLTDVDVNDELTLGNGILSIGEATLGINGTNNQLTDNIELSALSSLSFGGTDAITIPGTLFTSSPVINNLTINRSGGVTMNTDITVNGDIILQSSNPSAIKGSLDLKDGAVFKTLTMGSTATTMGAGDVTGIVRINTIVADTTYSMGNQFSSITFPNVGTLPSSMSMKIIIGTSPGWKPGAIKRIYDLVQTGGSGTQAVIVAHYLDSELNGNNEIDLVDWSYRYATGTYTEHGRSGFDATENWIVLSNVNVAFFGSGFGSVEVSLSPSELTTLTWNGSVTTSWITADNWTPLGAPSDNISLIIPDAATTPRDPVLPAFTTCKSVTLQSGSIVNSDATAELTLNGATGAWSNQGGTFNHANSIVYITNANATINGTTDFYDLSVNSGAKLTFTTGAITGIAGTLSNNGTINAGQYANTLEFNGGDQTVIYPNGVVPGFYHLVLSGTGNKTLPAKDIVVLGNFTLSESANTSPDFNIDITGNLSLGEGTTLDAGTSTYYVGGNFSNDGTFEADSSLLVFDGITQSLSGNAETSFNNLTINSGSASTVSSAQSLKGVLTCNGTLDAAGNLTLLSTSGQSALVDGSGTGTITGNLTMQRYLSSAFGYKYFSSPFQAATVSEFADDMDLGSACPGFYRYEENRDTAWWFDYTTGTNIMEPMTGYAVNFGSSADPATIDVEGVVSDGAMSVDLYNNNHSMTQGFNLVGNPYPSPIDWDAVSGWTRTNVDNAIYYFNSGSSNQYVGSYSTYINGVSSDGIANNIVPAMQGFFVHVSDGAFPVAASLGFSNQIRINTPNPVFHKQGLKSLTSLIRISAVYASTDSPVDPIVVTLDREALPTFNNSQDAIKLMNTDPDVVNFYTIAEDNRKYAIKALPEPKDTLTIIPLGITTLQKGIVGFSLLNAEMQNPWLNLYLRDNKNRAIIDLKNTSSYEVFLEKGVADNRFSLLLSMNEIQTNAGSRDELVVWYNDGKVFVYLDLAEGERGEILVTDIPGRIIHREIVSGTGYSPVNLSAANGIYVITLRTVNGIFSKKILIQ